MTITGSRPRDWYDLSYEQQIEWERREHAHVAERERLEADARERTADAERMAAHHARERAAFKSDAEDLEDENARIGATLTTARTHVHALVALVSRVITDTEPDVAASPAYLDARKWLGLAALVLALGLLGCDRTPNEPTNTPPPATTTIPPTTPRALLQPVGVFLFNNCTVPPTSTCAFNATLVNNGAGCAIRVEGTVRLFDVTGLQLGGPYRFVLPSTQVVQPAERVGYLANFVPIEQAQRAVSYLTDPLWIDTPCR